MAELKIPNPADPIRPIDRTVFGANVQRHPITGQPLETGINAATPSQQALNFCDELERHGHQTAGLPQGRWCHPRGRRGDGRAP